MLDGLIANINNNKNVKTLAKSKYTSSYIPMSTQKGCFLSCLGLLEDLLLGGTDTLLKGDKWVLEDKKVASIKQIRKVIKQLY